MPAANLEFSFAAGICARTGKEAKNRTVPERIRHDAARASLAPLVLRPHFRVPEKSPRALPCWTGSQETRCQCCIAAHAQIPISASPLSSSKGDSSKPNRIHRAKHAGSGICYVRRIIVRKRNRGMCRCDRWQLSSRIISSPFGVKARILSIKRLNQICEPRNVARSVRWRLKPPWYPSFRWRGERIESRTRSADV
jgi:hypothetical protein